MICFWQESDDKHIYMSDGHYSGEEENRKEPPRGCVGEGACWGCVMCGWTRIVLQGTLEKNAKDHSTAWRPEGLRQEAETASAKALRQLPLEKRQGSQCSGTRVNRGRAPEVRSGGQEVCQGRTLTVALACGGSH